MKSGIYALASLDGSPLHDADLTTLGLTRNDRTSRSNTWAARVVNEQPDSTVVDIVRAGNEILISLGYLDEIVDAQNRLADGRGLSPAQIISQTIDRFGPDAASLLLGDWSFVRWQELDRKLTLQTSLRIRDHLFWASDGKHIAVAPDQLLLTKLPWVGRQVEPVGFALNVSDYRLRRFMTRETMWRGVSRLSAGWGMHFTHGEEKEVRANSEAPPIAWAGTFEEATEEVTALGRRIVGQQMRRAGRSAFLLSGGLDSSLLTVWGSMERKNASDMFCLTSVASDRDTPDEWAFSKMLADDKGMEIFGVAPDPRVNLYRPSQASMEHLGQPLLGARHYLYEALQTEASAQGARVIFDGIGGEFTVSARDETGGSTNILKEFVSSIRSAFKGALAPLYLRDAFFLKLSPDLITHLPKEWNEHLKSSWRRLADRKDKGLKGIDVAIAKTAQAGTSAGNNSRYIYPYFDYRLLRFASGLPQSFFLNEKEDRRVARAILAAHAPLPLSKRKAGLPFSPDFVRRIRLQASTAKARIPTFRDAGLCEYFDLGWLDTALDHLSSGGDVYRHPLFMAPMTCMAAEFFIQ